MKFSDVKTYSLAVKLLFLAKLQNNLKLASLVPLNINFRAHHDPFGVERVQELQFSSHLVKVSYERELAS